MTTGRRGVALPLALLTIVVIGTVVAAVFGIASLEQRVGRNTVYLVQAASAAEAGAATTVGQWDMHGLDALRPGDSAVLLPAMLPGGAGYQTVVHRLSVELYELRSTGVRHDADGGTLASREVGLFVRRADSAAAGVLAVVPLAHRAWSSVR